MIVLSRLNLISISADTPLIVLREVAACHRLKFDTKMEHSRLLSGINLNPPPNIPMISETYYPDIAAFVNPNCDWSVSQLLVAYNWLKSFESTTTSLPDNYTIGWQTNDAPRNINACVLYHYCQMYNLACKAHTDLKDMDNMLKAYTQPISTLRIMMSDAAWKLDKGQIINVLQGLGLNIYTQVPCLSFKDLETAVSTVAKSNRARNNAEAVYLAARKYDINILDTRYPVSVYNLYRQNKVADKYIPNITDLKVVFDYRLPESYYKPERLYDMAISAGYTQADIEATSAYKLLQADVIGDTFYSKTDAKHVTNINKHNTLAETLTSLPSDQIVYYGRQRPEHSYMWLSTTELLMCFRCKHDFLTPNKFEVISANAIRKLELLTTNNELLAIIDSIRYANENKDMGQQSLVKLAATSSDMRTKIITNLIKLFELGQIMRGWISGPYITDSRPYTDDTEKYIHKALLEFDELLNSNTSIAECILALPLCRYVAGKYMKASDKNDGITIGDRLAIVKRGESGGNISSCVRLTSNWLCATAYLYLCNLDHIITFNIRQFRSIG